jgi:FkbM family methyltransferase
MSWLRATARAILERSVNRHRFNDSLLYHQYLNVFHPIHSKRKRAERRFYRQLLSEIDAKLVFDVGANGGQKAVIFSPLVDKVVCIEPSPAAAGILKDRFLYNPKVVVVAKGAGAEEGMARFHMFGDTDCYNTFSLKWAKALADSDFSPDRPSKSTKGVVDVPMVTLDQLIREYGVPSYVKVDVEGYEFHVIKGLTRAVPLISFESNLPEFMNETLETLSLVAARSPSARFNYCIEDPPARFESEQWLSHEQISTAVQSGGMRFMEIYCKS